MKKKKKEKKRKEKKGIGVSHRPFFPTSGTVRFGMTDRQI